MDRAGSKVRHHAGKGISTDDVQSLLDAMKSEMMSEIRAELGELTSVIREANRQLSSGVDKLSADIEALQSDSKARRFAQPERSPTKTLAACVQNICGGESRSRSGAYMHVPDEAGASPLPRSEVMSPRYRQQLQQEQAATALAGGPRLAAQAPQKQAASSSFSPIVAKFELAVSGEAAELAEASREPFISGLEALVQALDKMGGNMGSYLQTNITKLRNSKADASKTGYKEWLLSELPVHGATGYKGYVDDSAWMGNLWMAWTLEFFVEFFALLHKGKDTKSSVDGAYRKSLYNHHNFFQRTTFTAAVTQIPAREQLCKSLQGVASDAEVQRHMGDFVALGRRLVKFSLQMNETLDKRMQAERNAKR